MKYSLDKEEQFTILKLKEEKLDSTKAPVLKSDFLTLNAEGVQNMIVDMSEVKYVDSSGLSAVLVGNRVFSENSGIFILASPSEHALKLIKISQLDKVLNIVPSLQEAKEAVFMHEIEKSLPDEAEE
jgi:anti-sigma B factor antagonist